jgi:hypothetical protein
MDGSKSTNAAMLLKQSRLSPGPFPSISMSAEYICNDDYEEVRLILPCL